MMSGYMETPFLPEFQSNIPEQNLLYTWYPDYKPCNIHVFFAQ